MHQPKVLKLLNEGGNALPSGFHSGTVAGASGCL